MIRKFSLLLLSFVVTTSYAQKLQLEDITNKKYASADISSVVSSADGEHFFKPNTGKSMIIKYSYKTGNPVDTIFNATRARECDFKSFEGFLISPDEKRLIVYNDSEKIYRRSFKANYYYYDVRRNMVRKLTENTSKQSVPTFSKDGRMLAYVCDNNIWLAKFDYDTESQITKDGAFGKIINGATDWVYEEEFRVTKLIDFSADNKLLAFVRFDETAVPEFSFQEYGKLYPEYVKIKYPKAGENNSKVSCVVFDIESKTLKTMNVPTEKMEYLPRIEFLPNESQLAIMTLNRDQNELNMYYANARSAVCRLILHEVNKQYIDSDFLNSIYFIGDQFTYISERSGFSHIYLYGNSGVLQKTLTSGNFDITRILSVDTETKTVFYESTEESPLNRSVHKVDIIKGVSAKLSQKIGYNTAFFGSKSKYFINKWSDASTPTLVTINDANGKELRVLEDNKALKEKLANTLLPKKEFIKVKTKDNTELNAWIIKPANFNPAIKYPLLMVQYSGPNSQEVLNKYGVDWVDYLANEGYIVACVDGRGTGARGEDFRKCTYLNLGIKESDDQIDAAKQLGALPYIDKDKIAIWGWSYGGYNVLMSMSRGNGIFKAGVAIAPVTDWRFYDSVYAERFMRTPQQNTLGYDTGSPIKLANKLEGNLLLIHGSSDDNVHFQNTLEYADALVKANKQFEMFVFTNQNHSIEGPHNRTYLYNKVIKFLKSNL